MHPPIYTIAQSNIQPWFTYTSKSNQDTICAQKNISPQELRDNFAAAITQQTLTDLNFSATMVQHPGVRYGAAKEDKVFTVEMPFNNLLTHEDLLIIIKNTMQQVGEKVHLEQANRKLLNTGTTFAGVFVFGEYFITIEAGDSVIFSITWDPILECIPLVPTHEFHNIVEKDRVLMAMLSNNNNDDVLTMLYEVKKFSASIKTQFSQLYTNPTNEGIIDNYFKRKFASYSKNEQIQKNATTRLSAMLQAQSQSDGNILFTLEKFLADRSPEITVNYLNAIYSDLRDNIACIDVENIHELAPTRGFGDIQFKSQGYTCEPDIKFYRLPTHPCLIFLASDGISECLSAFDTVTIAKNYRSHPSLGPIPEVNVAALASDLMYHAYTYDEEKCDNLSINALYLSGKSLQQKAYFSAVLDGHSDSSAHDSPKHVANFVANLLPCVLRQNLTNAICQKLMVAHGQSLVIFSELPFFSSGCIAEAESTVKTTGTISLVK